MTLGVFGGTFDPVHNAHLRLARDAREQLRLERVIWVPSGNPGHRAAPAASAADRVAMLRLALRDEPGHELDITDANTSAPVYTVNTLARLRGRCGATMPLALLIGSDQLLAFETWRDWRGILDLAHLAVAQRPGHAVSTSSLSPGLRREYAVRCAPASSLAASPAGRIVLFDMASMDISASAIRARLADEVGRPGVRGLLPDSVLDYIETRQLYSCQN